MKPLWLLGLPGEAGIARSPSPAMHNAGLVALGEQPVYALHPCLADDLGLVLDDAERTCRGINVTAPFKVRAATRYAAVLDEDACAAGAVNTVVFASEGQGTGAAVARNTDVRGLVASWRRSAFHVEGRTLAVIGSGGAARAVIVAAHRAKACAVVVHARRLDAALALVEVAARLGLDATAAPLDRAASLGATMAIVATSALDDPAAWLDRALAGPGAVHDLRYGARAHAVRDAALARGHLFADGTLLLLEQGRLALAAFTGGTVGDEATNAMRLALTSSLTAGDRGATGSHLSRRG